ncbi:MAG: hypothetical protein PHE49_08690 [bacterium]|nr:hypothetical protein [bacterium]
MKKYTKALQKIKITAVLMSCVFVAGTSYARDTDITKFITNGDNTYKPEKWADNVFKEITVTDKSNTPQKVIAISDYKGTNNQYYTFVAYVKDNKIQNILPLDGNEFFSGVGENNNDYVFKDFDIDGDSINEILAITYTVGGQGTNFAYINILKDASKIFDLCLSEVRYQTLKNASGDSVNVPMSEADLFVIRYHQEIRELEIKTDYWTKVFVWDGKKIVFKKLEQK